MSLLIGLIALWILWKLFKFSLWLLSFLIIVALVGFFIKALLIPAIVLIVGGLAVGFGSIFH
ncbi:hypothetical protein [Limosilactobacillus caecicola]|uniref:hypothetical protein n=1 Tax=Limosilactobacillus caecicola TaxID=2941332 RepID=UPI00203FC67A|nr:hypothetical protein [Limosilactobacillus caecicola]